MPIITPKTDWSTTNMETISVNDINRIEGNEQTIYDNLYINDYDNNLYRVKKYGSTLWTIDNWRSTKFNDGSSIQLLAPGDAFKDVTTPGYCKYADSSSRFGLYYNWYAASTLIMPPPGWRLPTSQDHENLVSYGISRAWNNDNTITGNKLRDAFSDRVSWLTEVDDVGDMLNYNISGFNFQGSGLRTYDFITDTYGYFNIGREAYSWLYTEDDTDETKSLGIIISHASAVIDGFLTIPKSKWECMPIRFCRDI